MYNYNRCCKNMITEKKLLEIISRTVGKKVSIKSKSSQFDKWDSLGQLQILSKLDKATKGKTSNLITLTNAKSVKDIKKILIKSKLLKDKI